MVRIKSGFKATFLIVVLLMSMGVVTIHSAEPELLLVQSKVTQRDAQGRVKVMETYANGGACVTEVTYSSLRIYIDVVTISNNARFRHPGSLQIQIKEGTEDGLSDAVLMRFFNWTIKEYCLPFIVRGYIKV